MYMLIGYSKCDNFKLHVAGRKFLAVYAQDYEGGAYGTGGGGYYNPSP